MEPADHEAVMLALMILAAVWAVTMLLVVSLCRLAQRGDDAQASASPRAIARRARPRGAHGAPVRTSALRR